MDIGQAYKLLSFVGMINIPLLNEYQSYNLNQQVIQMALYDTTFDKPFIGYDGSQTCDIVLSIFKEMHSKFDKTVLVHVCDPMKNYLLSPMKGPAIEMKANKELEGLKNIDVKLIKKEKTETRSTNQMILAQLLASKSTCMFLGFVGQKGRKPRSVELSSRIRRFVYDTKIPVVVIKKPKNETNSVIFCFDGSQISHQGLKKAVCFCKKFDSNLTVLHTYSQITKNYSKQVKNTLKNLQNQYKGVNLEVIVEENGLVEYLSENGSKYDWIMMNRNGYRGQISNKIFVGSKTTAILSEIENNLIILT